jgi:hypothetical protein
MINITRDLLCEKIKNVFGDYDTFLDLIEFGDSNRFELFVSNGDCVGSGNVLLLDLETGYFLRWYKLTHIGRDLYTNMTIDELDAFLNDAIMAINL